MITTRSFSEFEFLQPYTLGEMPAFELEEQEVVEAVAQVAAEPTAEPQSEKSPSEPEESSEPTPALSKLEIRRLKNKESALISRIRKQEKLDRLELIESQLLAFNTESKSLNESLPSGLKPHFIKLQELCKSNSPKALSLLLSLFMTTMQENSKIKTTLNTYRETLHALSNSL